MDSVTTDADAALFESLYPALRRFAAVVAPLGVDPDDLVQEAVVRVLRRGSLSRLRQPKAYVCRAVLNLASNERRSDARRRRALERLGAETAGKILDEQYPSDLSDLLLLKARDRAVLYLRVIESGSYDEIAATLGLRLGAVRMAVSRARRRLQARWDEEVKA